MSADDLDGEQGLPDLGMDSLMAVELSNRLQRTRRKQRSLSGDVRFTEGNQRKSKKEER